MTLFGIARLASTLTKFVVVGHPSVKDQMATREGGVNRSR
jgi:hypothetical protein